MSGSAEQPASAGTAYARTESKRRAPDGNHYTQAEFNEHYGTDLGEQRWQSAPYTQEEFSSTSTTARAEQPAQQPAPVTQINIRSAVFKPLLAHVECDRETNAWLLPVPLPDVRLLGIDWSSILQLRPDRVVSAVMPTFYLDEPDSNQHDMPRLDLLVSFTDGSSVRYHPQATPIWSDQWMPTEAMQKRYNRARKLGRSTF
jgi:hypothetical protein